MSDQERNRLRQGSSASGSGNERTERLNQAIDRMLGGSESSLPDSDLQDLLQLAARLSTALPRDLPDPAFRASLGQRLTSGRPPLAAVPRVAEPTQRFPYPVALSAFAAVLVAAIALGSFGIWMSGNDDTPRDTTLAGVPDTATQTPVGSTLALSTSTSAVETVAFTPTPRPEFMATSTQMTQPTIQATFLSTRTPSATATVAQTPEPATTPMTATAEPTSGPQLADLPPVDGAHVSLGPVPAASGGATTPHPDNTYQMAVDLPELEPTSWLFYMAAPATAPEEFVTRVGAALGIESEVFADFVNGRMDYHVDGMDGESFHWHADTGEFSYVNPASPSGIDTTAEDVTQAALVWLDAIGYPIETLDLEARAEPFDDLQWIVELRMSNTPQPGIGFPIGVTLFVDSNGTVLSGSGYWLALTHSSEVVLQDVRDAWQQVLDGNGYWTGGGIVAEQGEFRCSGATLSWVLTKVDDGALVLQPVARFSGEFEPLGGGPAEVAVFVPVTRELASGTP